MDIENNFSKLLDNHKDQDNVSNCSTECFICFEHCTTPTPCSCNLYAHAKCIKKFREASGQQMCSVCLTEHKPIDKKTKILKYIGYFISFVFLYIILGVLGQFLEYWVTEKPFIIQPFWSLEHFIPAVVLLIFILIPCLVFIKKIEVFKDCTYYKC